MPLQIESETCPKPPLLFSIDSIVGISSYQECDSSSKGSKSLNSVPKSTDVITSDGSDEEVSNDYDKNKELFNHLANFSKVYPKNSSLAHLNSSSFAHPFHPSTFNSNVTLPIDNPFHHTLHYNSPEFVNHLNHAPASNEHPNGPFNSARLGATSSMNPNLMRYLGNTLYFLLTLSVSNNMKEQYQYTFFYHNITKSFIQIILNDIIFC